MAGYANFDAATATPLHPVAAQALQAAQADGWAEPARLYTAARRARQLLDAARESVAEVFGVRPTEVGFVANGTRAAHAAVAGALLAASERTGRPGRLIHSAIEHSSVLHAATAHARHGGDTAAVGCDQVGRTDAREFALAVGRPGVALAALIAASHEVGTLQPVVEAAQVCATAGVPLYVDAAAAVGRMPLTPGWSLCTASARKWGGPAGVGILVVPTGTRWLAPWPGAHPDQRDEPGGLNLPAVVAAAASLRAVAGEAAVEAQRLAGLVDRIRAAVAIKVPDVDVLGDPRDRLPHVVTFSCLYLDGEALVQALDVAGFAVSSGSACTADTLQPSHVLAAMGALTHGNIRISLHREVHDDDVDRFLAVLPEIVARLRQQAGVS
jgi:cysteine desulfurase